MYRARFAAWIIGSVHGLKNELNSCVAFLFRFIVRQNGERIVGFVVKAPNLVQL